MGTFTAQILIGHSHRYGGGIIPTHGLYLSENSRPTWILKHLDLFENEHESEVENKRIRWIPSVDHMLEDAMVLIGVHVLKDESLLNEIKLYGKSDNLDDISVYGTFTNEEMQKLYKLARTMKIGYKLALSIYDVSHIFRQIKTLDAYNCQADVFTVTHKNYKVESFVESGW